MLNGSGDTGFKLLSLETMRSNISGVSLTICGLVNMA